MSLNSTPMGERVHIGIFGRRNAGKSSLINAFTGQGIAVVSEVPGTTTDPVQKTMELLPLGPVVLIDTPGLDDTGDLGVLRVGKAVQALNRTDIALLVVDAGAGMTEADREILERIRAKGIPCLVVANKVDLLSGRFPAREELGLPEGIPLLEVSAKTGRGVPKLRETVASLAAGEKARPLVGDLLSPGDLVLLVIPLDKAAPKGRLILPQQQTIRDILDHGGRALAVRDQELEKTLEELGRKPDLVITDSQVFSKVAPLVPREIPLTSFSILFARKKGDLEQLAQGARTLDCLRDGDRVLISEGCTHHRQCDDIGTVKLPAWIRAYTGKELQFSFTGGTGFPEDLAPYRLVIHCGGCMLGDREVGHRMACARAAGVPMTNYGTAIAHMNGILERSTELFHRRRKAAEE